MILSVLSTSFLISLIVPIPSISSHLEPQDQAGEEENQDDDDDLFENIEDSTISSKPTPSIALPTDLTLESIDNLAFELSRIDHFDTRRIIEYSSDKGRAALSRSLKSDAHVEVLLSPSTEHSQTSNHSEVSSKDKKRSENKETRLKEYKPLLELLRKSSGLIVFLVLPSPPSTSTGTSSDRSELDLSTEAVLGPFGSGVHIPGIRVFDLRERSVPGRRSSRSSCGKPSLKDEGDEGLDGEREDQAVVGEEEESEETEAWREGAERIKALRKGWR